MLALRYLSGFAVLLAALATIAAAVTAPHTFQQTNRQAVAERMQMIPDGSWIAEKSKRSSTPVVCTPGEYPGGGSCSCTYTYDCQTITTGVALGAIIAPTFPDCVTACDNLQDCSGVSYQFSTETCTILAQIVGSSMNPDYASAVFVASSCSGTVCT